MSQYLSADLVCEALKQALFHRNPPPGLMFHSDRGSQYSSVTFRGLLHEHGFIQSMSKKGDCYDNAPVESFFKTLKVEEVHRRIFNTRSDARLAIFQYVEIFYNRVRLHSSLNYMSPQTFESHYHDLQIITSPETKGGV